MTHQPFLSAFNDSISYNQLLSHIPFPSQLAGTGNTWHDLAWPGLLQPQLLRLPLPFQLPLLNLLHQAPIFGFLQSQLLLFGTQTRQIGQGLHLLDLTPENIWKMPVFGECGKSAYVSIKENGNGNDWNELKWYHPFHGVDPSNLKRLLIRQTMRSCNHWTTKTWIDHWQEGQSSCCPSANRCEQMRTDAKSNNVKWVKSQLTVTRCQLWGVQDSLFEWGYLSDHVGPLVIKGGNGYSPFADALWYGKMWIFHALFLEESGSKEHLFFGLWHFLIFFLLARSQYKLVKCIQKIQN